MEKSLINNEFYHSMGELWYHGEDHPIALLRQESLVKNKWIMNEIRERQGIAKPGKILDIGCGAGFFCNLAAQEGFEVSGVDAADDALKVARQFDATKSVQYINSDARKTPFADESFDVVTSLDFLEHIDEPQKVIQEAARVLKPGGLFFFHTFSRNFLTYLVIIKAVEWLVKNAPKDLHIYRLFIKPRELDQMCASEGLQTLKWIGLRPIVNLALVRMILTGKVSDQFRFTTTSNLHLSYLGVAQKAPAVDIFDKVLPPA